MLSTCTLRLTLALFLAVVAALGAATTAGSQEGGPATSTSVDLLPGKPRCFGAAARDPARACGGAKRVQSVVPRPRDALALPPAACSERETEGLVSICSFGLAAEKASTVVALVGDSHAAHWRGALDPVATAKGWHGLSIMHGGCPLSKAVRALTPAGRRSGCGEWKQQVFSWFTRHPEVSTVFVSGLSGGSGVVRARGRSEFETSVAGYRAAWRALPRSVQRIVVLRDTPKMRGRVNACVERAMRVGTPAGLRCAVSRKSALDPDPLLAAAKGMRSRRMGIVDLTRFFCDRARCYPVIGGALAFKDSTHLTPLFSETLATFLLGAVNRVLATPR